jgi:hypothetical protein
MAQCPGFGGLLKLDFYGGVAISHAALQYNSVKKTIPSGLGGGGVLKLWIEKQIVLIYSMLFFAGKKNIQPGLDGGRGAFG